MDRVGRYEIRGVINRGRTTTVFHARDPLLDREVAIYVFEEDGLADHGEQCLAKVGRHPGIVEIFDAGVHEGRPFHVLELVDGRSLAEMIRAEVQVPTSTALAIAQSVANALHHLHRLGMRHNDVHPNNVVLRSSGEPVLVDFRRADETPRGPASAGSDLRGLADTLGCLLAGTLEVPSQHELEALVSPWIVDAIRRCHRDEIASADAFARSLRAMLEALHADEPTRALEPREGETLLLRADNRGDQAGRYREYHVEQHLGDGGFGDVFSAVEQVSGRRVALKVLKRELLADADAVARFRREADVLATLDHPNIVRIYNYGRFGGSVFIAMEHLDGATLATISQQEAPVDVATACRLVNPLLGALEALDGAGIVHRDVKPSNVKVADDRVVLLDFGIAAVNGWQPLTQIGGFVGTIRYSSPEQVRGDRLTGASDVYAAGVILYELLTRERTHAPAEDHVLMLRIASESVAPIESRRSNLPPALATLCTEMLALEPSDRPTAAQARQTLAQLG